MAASLDIESLFSTRSFLKNLITNPVTNGEKRLSFLANQVSHSTELGYGEHWRKDFRSAFIQYSWASEKIDQCLEVAEYPCHKDELTKAKVDVQLIKSYLVEELEKIGIFFPLPVVEEDDGVRATSNAMQNDARGRAIPDGDCDTIGGPENPFLDHFRQKVLDPNNPAHDHLFKTEIFGYSDVLQLINERLILPQIPIRGKPVKESDRACAMMFFGPCGTGKTSLAHFVSQKLKLKLLEITGADLASPYYGNNILKMTAAAEVVKSIGPAILFIDEMEIIFPSRDSTNSDMKSENLGQFMVEMNFITAHNKEHPDKQVILIGTSNHPGMLDDGAFRRCERHVHVGLPTVADRKAILQGLMVEDVSLDHLLNKVDWETVMRYTEDFSPADLFTLAKNIKDIPFLKTQVSEFFKLVSGKNEEFDHPKNVWMACHEFHPGAHHVSMLHHINPNDFINPPLTAQDVILAASRQRPTNKSDDENGMVKACMKFAELWSVQTNLNVRQMLNIPDMQFDSQKALEAAHLEMNSRNNSADKLPYLATRAFRDGLIERKGEWIAFERFERIQNGHDEYKALRTIRDQNPTQQHFAHQVQTQKRRLCKKKEKSEKALADIVINHSDPSGGLGRPTVKSGVMGSQDHYECEFEPSNVYDEAAAFARLVRKFPGMFL